MVRIGFVGSGLIVWAHGLGLKAMIDGGVIDASIVTVHDPRQRQAQGFLDVVGGEGASPAADATEVAERADVVWVCTPTSAHRPAVDAALSAGRASVLRETARSRSWRVPGRSPSPRRPPGWPPNADWFCAAPRCSEPCATLLPAGRLALPWPPSSETTSSFPIQGHYASKWRSDVEQAGGGCLIEHSIHDVDILRFCFGEVRQVSARTANFAGHEGIEDLAAVTLSFESGFEAQLTSVWHNILSRGSTRRIEVFFRDAMVWLDDEFRGPLHIQTADGTEVRPCPSPDWVDALPLAERRGRPGRAGLRRGRPGLRRRRHRRASHRSRAWPRPWRRTAWWTPPTVRPRAEYPCRSSDAGRLGPIATGRAGCRCRSRPRSADIQFPLRRASLTPLLHPRATKLPQDPTVRSLLRVFTQQPLAAKVPEVTVLFWVIKISTTAAGEGISDWLANTSRVLGFFVEVSCSAPRSTSSSELGATAPSATGTWRSPSRPRGPGSPTRCTSSSGCPTR